MVINKIKLVNFRNHINNLFLFDKKNFIIGRNGSGKTSILESISVIFTGKSFKTNKLKTLINTNCNFFQVNSEFVKRDINHNIEIRYNTKKRLSLDGKVLEKTVNFYFDNPVVFYSPDNEGFLSKEQENRRNFLDRLIFYINFNHLDLLRNYNRLLDLKKNYIVKNIKDKLLYKAIHEKILPLSLNIIKNRSEMIDKLNTYIEKYLKEIPSLKTEIFSLQYKPNYIDDGLLEQELATKTVLSGPHRDRIFFTLNGELLENMASFGQKKSLSLCCIYCFIKVVEDFSKNDIILLLDELESGLDKERVYFFMELFDKYHYFVTGQSLINNKFNIINLT
jgi:DNA replication and repair protein RecF